MTRPLFSRRRTLRWLVPVVALALAAGLRAAPDVLAAQSFRFEIDGQTVTIGNAAPTSVAKRVGPIRLTEQAATNSTVLFNLAALSGSGVYCYLPEHEELEASGKAHAFAGYLRIAG